MAGFVLEIVTQARWKSASTGREADAWQTEFSDDTSRAKLFYILGLLEYCATA